MSAITATESASSTTGGMAEEQVNDASTTTNTEMEDVKTVLNGTQTSVTNSEEES